MSIGWPRDWSSLLRNHSNEASYIWHTSLIFNCFSSMNNLRLLLAKLVHLYLFNSCRTNIMTFELFQNIDPWSHTNIIKLSNLLFLFSWVNQACVRPSLPCLRKMFEVCENCWSFAETLIFCQSCFKVSENCFKLTKTEACKNCSKLVKYF